MANDSKKYVSLTRLSDFLDNIKTKFSEIGHKHTTSDLTDYRVDSELSPDSNNPVANKVLDAEFEAMATAMGALELAIDSKADSDHIHDDKYYTKEEFDNAIAQKSQAQIITWEADD